MKDQDIIAKLAKCRITSEVQWEHDDKGRPDVSVLYTLKGRSLVVHVRAAMAYSCDHGWVATDYEVECCEAPVSATDEDWARIEYWAADIELPSAQSALEAYFTGKAA